MKIRFFIIQQSTVLHKIQKPVHPQNPRIHRGWFITFQQPAPVRLQVLNRKAVIMRKKHPDGTAVDPDGAGGVPLFFKVDAKVRDKCFEVHNVLISSHLPVDHPVDNLILLAAGTTQVNPGCFEIFVSKQVGEQGNIAAFFDKTLGKPVAECMRMYHFRCHVVGEGNGFELAADAAGGDGGTEAVEEDGTVGFVEKGKPFEGIGSE